MRRISALIFTSVILLSVAGCYTDDDRTRDEATFYLALGTCVVATAVAYAMYKKAPEEVEFKRKVLIEQPRQQVVFQQPPMPQRPVETEREVVIPNDTDDDEGPGSTDFDDENPG